MNEAVTRAQLFVLCLIAAVAVAVALAWPSVETPDGPVKPAAVEGPSVDICLDGNFDNDPPECKRD